MRKWRLELIILVFISIGFTACCSCGSSGDENVVKGVIVIVGHEPFTKLAVKLDDEKNYILECSEELKKELWNQQGNFYAIQFSKKKIEADETILIVEKITPLNKNTKK